MARYARLLVRHGRCITDKRNAGNAHYQGFGWSASNWSGYRVTGKEGAFRSVGGTWIVPRLKPSREPAYSSAWVGIDGYSNNSLIQTGTAHEYVNGQARYYAWWEILPAAATRIPLPVSPGDRMSASIRRLRGRKWLIRLANLTKGWLFRIVRIYNGPLTSAEWIVEAPQVNGRLAALARYGRTAFACCTVNGRNPRLTKSDGGVMIQNGRQVSTPTAPNAAGNGFAVFYGPSARKPRMRGWPRPLIKPRGSIRT